MQNTDEGVELSQPSRQGGYAAAASWLASDPDGETLVFRKFDKLSALSLLYMQSEILELERKLRDIDKATVESYDMDLKDAASTWETLVRQCQPGDEFRKDARERMDLILDLREKLRKYHKALLLQSEIAGLKKPEDRVIEVVKHIFEQPQHILGGKAKFLFEDKSPNAFNDLVALKPSDESDFLSNFLRRHWRAEEEVARDGISRFRRFEERLISRTVSVVTIIVAAVFLIGTIIGFYFVQSPSVKLTMIAVFTVAFAGSLVLITNARRAEIFAATSAYAAVLVVFVSNSDLSSSSSPQS